MQGDGISGYQLGKSKDQTVANMKEFCLACKISGYHRAALYQAQFNHAKIILKLARKQNFTYDVTWW